ncbi:MAG: hypothetical protein K6G16_10160 [Lachnospiraceae bacterium]|nr:hypothetical protein [Lachnospiraceae bacterium]
MKRAGLILAGAVASLSLLALCSDTAQAAMHEHGYTYRYDYWEDVQDSPDVFSVTESYTSADLMLELKMKNPQGLYAHENHLYICDTGNNRIIELIRDDAKHFSVSRIIDSFTGGSGVNTLSAPTDIAISEDGNVFIADQGNARILKLDENLECIMEYGKPEDSALDEGVVFQPYKIAVDTAERVYCVARGINKGLCKYEADGSFSGFVGALPATYNLWDYLWKKVASQEQLSKMTSFVPTEYDNLYMDYEGFIYAVTGNVKEEDLKSGQVTAVRKLNLIGNDILVRNGDYDNYGDLYMGDGGGHQGPSLFSDVTVFDNDTYVCLDRNRGRAFGYDDQGRLMFAFGGNGNEDGCFNWAIGIDHIGNDLYILDQQTATLTSFSLTEFGQLVFRAIEEFDNGNYNASGETWEEVMKLNGNYDLAYIGIGRSLLRQKKYREAMDYFEIKYDDENYSKAFKQYRKEWVEGHIVWIVVFLLALFLIPMAIGRFYKIRHDIETADIFIVNR